LETKLSTMTEVGLKIEVYLEQSHVNLPLTARFVYMFDQVRFEKWCKEHKDLQEGIAICLCVKGVRVWMLGLNNEKEPQSDTVGFLISDGDADIKLPLLEREVVFVVNREPVNKKEWNVLVEDFHARLNPTF